MSFKFCFQLQRAPLHRGDCAGQVLTTVPLDCIRLLVYLCTRTRSPHPAPCVARPLVPCLPAHSASVHPYTLAACSSYAKHSFPDCDCLFLQECTSQCAHTHSPRPCNRSLFQLNLSRFFPDPTYDKAPVKAAQVEQKRERVDGPGPGATSNSVGALAG
jgi:hypothetical protein